jgi:hypothetical protein
MTSTICRMQIANLGEKKRNRKFSRDPIGIGIGLNGFGKEVSFQLL